MIHYTGAQRSMLKMSVNGVMGGQQAPLIGSGPSAGKGLGQMTYLPDELKDREVVGTLLDRFISTECWTFRWSNYNYTSLGRPYAAIQLDICLVVILVELSSVVLHPSHFLPPLSYTRQRSIIAAYQLFHLLFQVHHIIHIYNYDITTCTNIKDSSELCPYLFSQGLTVGLCRGVSQRWMILPSGLLMKCAHCVCVCHSDSLKQLTVTLNYPPSHKLSNQSHSSPQTCFCLCPTGHTLSRSPVSVCGPGRSLETIELSCHCSENSVVQLHYESTVVGSLKL